MVQTSRSLPTLQPSLAALIGDESPIDYEGDWYLENGQWRFLGRWKGTDHKFDPATVPDSVREQARASLGKLEYSMMPAEIEELEHALAEVAIVCGSKSSDGTEVWKARYAIYARHLDDIPRDILRKALDKHIETSVFFPKISELRELAGPDLAKRKYEIRRLKELLGLPLRQPSVLEIVREREGIRA